MKNPRSFILFLLLLALSLACSLMGRSSLTVIEKSYTHRQLRSLGTITIDDTNDEGKTTRFTGVPVITLLADAGLTSPVDDAMWVSFTSKDSSKELFHIYDFMDCTECIVAFDNRNLHLVMPGMPDIMQIHNLINIDIEWELCC